MTLRIIIHIHQIRRNRCRNRRFHIGERIAYDTHESMLRYIHPGEYTQDIMKIYMFISNLELDDILLIFNTYKLQSPDTYSSLFNANIQQHKIFHKILEEMESISEGVMDDSKKGNSSKIENPRKDKD